jgi:hypothetical protein
MSAQSHRAAERRLPLYRREPWLAVLLVALIVMVAALLLPVEHRRWPVIVAGVLGTAGLLMLMLHRPHPHSDQHLRDIRLPESARGNHGRARDRRDEDADDMEQDVTSLSS